MAVSLASSKYRAPVASDAATNLPGSNRSNRRSKQLHTLFKTVRSAPENVVGRLLTEIRGSHREPHQLIAAPEPWQSTEGTFRKALFDA